MKLPSFPNRRGQQNQPEEEFVPFPDLPPQKQTKFKTEYAIFTGAIVLFIFSLSFYLVLNPDQSNTSSNPESTSPTQHQAQAAPTPTPKPLPSGKQTYRFSHGSQVTGPKPSVAIIDPIDPEIGDTQTFSIEVSHTTPVSKATAILITDNQQKEIPLSLSSGTENQGTWTGSWKMEDTYNYNYQLQLIIHDTTETYSGSLNFR